MKMHSMFDLDNGLDGKAPEFPLDAFKEDFNNDDDDFIQALNATEVKEVKQPYRLDAATALRKSRESALMTILQEIERAAEAGHCALGPFKEISPQVVKQLESLGYSLIPHAQKGFYRVSWDEEDKD